MNIRKEIGAKIKAAREEKGLSQEELADMAKVARRTIINIEQGAFNPKIETVNDIAKALDCKIEIAKAD